VDEEEVFVNDAVVVIAAHANDEVFGCGGTIARMADEGRTVHIVLLADGETSCAGAGAATGATRAAATAKACRVLGCTSTETLELPHNCLDELALLNLVNQVESVIKRHRASTVLTHHSADVSVDHRIAHEAVLAACRPQPGHSAGELLFFEIASSTEWRPPASSRTFIPNLFVDISATLARKLDALRAYESELREFPHPRSLEAVEARARWRGATAGFDAAEALVVGRKIEG
jgi:N-acetylglucosamine malate deacetylase 1